MIPGVDSWAVAVALSLDSVWSPWAWIPFGFALDDSGVNGCGGAVVALSFVERTTRQRKSNEQTIVCVGLALDDSGHGVGVDFSSWEPCGCAVAVGFLLLDSVWRFA